MQVRATGATLTGTVRPAIDWVEFEEAMVA